MGRKALVRERKELTEKAKIWVREVVPLLQDQELDKLTLDELAFLMGKSKSTIYSYFSTKDEIYQTAVQLYLSDIAFIISPEAIEGENMEQVLHGMLMKIGEGLAGISIHFLDQIQEFFPEIWSIIEGFNDRVLANFEAIYRKGMNSGEFKEFNVKLLLTLDRHFVMSIMTDARQFQDQNLSLPDLIKEYLELRMSALRFKE